MPDTIEVIFPATSESGFNTPEEAIAFSKSIDRARLHEGVSSCMGQTITFTDWREDAIFIKLDSDKTLHFGCAGDVVDLTIEAAAPSDVSDSSSAQELVPVWPSGEKTHWKCGELMRALRGNTFRRLQASQSGFFLYVANTDILRIAILRERSTGRPFLYWGPAN